MRMTGATTLAVAAWLVFGLCVPDSATGNGGPFVLKHPQGDPAAKGVLARLDPTLKPARETRLRVVKENLTISFERNRWHGNRPAPPLATVSAAYTIENPTGEAVQVDFGFPILRGIHVPLMSMRPSPDVWVTAGGKNVKPTVISNSLIYGVIRQRARETIENAVAADAKLARLVAGVRGAAATAGREAARHELSAYLTARLKWNERDAALLVEYAGLDFGKPKSHPRDRWLHLFWSMDRTATELLSANLGPLSAIGEQRATQLFAQLAGRFDKESAAAYEAIFQAWGGDVRERAVDMQTGRVRRRENTTPAANAAVFSPTVYARVDYLDSNAKLSEAEKASCQAILKNLPVVFTFAPMNLVHYQVDFPANSKQVVTVKYKQYAYTDTGEGARASYQLAYVVHPASLWDDFGPINLKVHVPKGLACRASVPMKKAGEVLPVNAGLPGSGIIEVYEAVLVDAKDKTGELFVAVEKAGWDTPSKPAAQQAASQAPARVASQP